jgi:hypothetical protein
MGYTAVGLVYLYVHTQECGMKAGPLGRVPGEKRHLPPLTAMGGWAEDTSNPQRLRPPRWTSQMVNATEATTAMMSRMSVFTAVIYLARSKLVIGR